MEIEYNTNFEVVKDLFQDEQEHARYLDVMLNLFRKEFPEINFVQAKGERSTFHGWNGIKNSECVRKSWQLVTYDKRISDYKWEQICQIQSDIY